MGEQYLMNGLIEYLRVGYWSRKEAMLVGVTTSGTTLLSWGL